MIIIPTTIIYIMIVTKIIPNIEIIIVMITKAKMIDPKIVAKNLTITIVTKQ